MKIDSIIKTILLVLICSLAGCNFPKKEKPKTGASTGPTIADQNPDITFQSFIGRLRKAAANRDAQMLASLMTADFGYRWDQAAQDENVFQYWDQKELWGELQAVLKDKFVPKGQYMVAPAQFAKDPDAYHGYRAGVAQVNGSWRFVYFVTDEAPVAEPPH